MGQKSIHPVLEEPKAKKGEPGDNSRIIKTGTCALLHLFYKIPIFIFFSFQ